MLDVSTLPVSDVNEIVYRIIPFRHSQVDLFERVSNPNDWEALHTVESWTNPQLRDEIGDISLVPEEDRVHCDGANWIMAAFTHPPSSGRGGRFNRGFGVYYCAKDEDVAIAETSFHRARFLKESGVQQTTVDMRVIIAHLGPVSLHDVRGLSGHAIYSLNDYAEGQKLGDALRGINSYGLHYGSVRASGECYGVMRANALTGAWHWRDLRYHYEQGAITNVKELA